MDFINIVQIFYSLYDTYVKIFENRIYMRKWKEYVSYKSYYKMPIFKDRNYLYSYARYL